MTRYYALPLATKYWMPNTNYTNEVVDAVKGKIHDGDYVAVSEKAVSTAKNRILDENNFETNKTAKFLATAWMHFAWGYPLGILCGFGQRLLRRLRRYPAEEGSRHKQVALQYAGFGQALMFGSEGGIDGSNLPYSLVSMPLTDAYEVAEEIRVRILQELCVRVTVIITDTDKTYSFRNFHFTPRPRPMKGIQSRGDTIAYVLGRFFRLRRRPTPLAVAGEEISAEDALTIANVADRARGPGSGATVWDMAARFRVSETEVTWDMLGQVKHKPLVIVRLARSQSRIRDQQNR